MKSYTDIEQSKKLAEILPIESADGHYVRKLTDFMGNPANGEWSNPKYGNPNSKHANYMVQNFTSYEIIPCWSLAALLNILPQKYYPIKDHETNLILGKPKDKWCVLYWDATGMQDGEQTLGGSPIDACVEMILKLKEKNLI